MQLVSRGGSHKPAISCGRIFSLGGQGRLNKPGAVWHLCLTENADDGSFTAYFERFKPRRLQQLKPCAGLAAPSNQHEHVACSGKAYVEQTRRFASSRATGLLSYCFVFDSREQRDSLPVVAERPRPEAESPICQRLCTRSREL